MKERPILFSALTIRAILGGRKTQTRRVVKGEVVDGATARACPYGTVGDRLWIKETFTLDFLGPRNQVVLRADEPRANCKWKPSIFMPRKFSRIILEITGVRIARLCDISEVDAVAEGCEPRFDHAKHCDGKCDLVCNGSMVSSKMIYRELWESINGKGSWNLNPWVWVLNFKRI